MKPGALRGLRIQAGLTQQELAGRLGVHRVTLAGWELGRHRIPAAVDLALQKPKGVAAEPGGAAGSMPPRRARVIRAELGLTRRALAKQMGIESAVVARWETGAVRIPGLAARLLACLYSARPKG